MSENQAAKFFTLLADETTDYSQREQLSVCFRYVLPDSTIRERLFCFAHAPDLTGSGLAKQLLQIIEGAGLDPKLLVGQGYDGASAMSGTVNGVQKHVQDVCPSAVYVHCFAHKLNLCLSKAASIPLVNSAVTLMNDTATFFCDFNKRLQILQSCIDTECPETSRICLKKHCDTRWVESQTAVIVFKESYPAVVAAVEAATSLSGETGAKATIMLHAMNDSFLLAVEVLHAVMSVTKPLSVRLQSASQDVMTATKSVEACIDVLRNIRSGDLFQQLFTDVERITGNAIQMPRVVGRQRNRANAPSETPLEHYRRNLFFPFIDACIMQLQVRFGPTTVTATQLCSLIPAWCCDRSFDLLTDGIKLYE